MPSGADFALPQSKKKQPRRYPGPCVTIRRPLTLPSRDLACCARWASCCWTCRKKVGELVVALLLDVSDVLGVERTPFGGVEKHAGRVAQGIADTRLRLIVGHALSPFKPIAICHGSHLPP